MKTVYLISYDNGMSYEDHDTDVVCVALSHATAKAELIRLGMWLERARSLIPDVPAIPTGPEPLEDTKEGRAWLKAHDANERAIKRARMPHGCELVRHSLTDRDEGRFLIHKAKLI